MKLTLLPLVIIMSSAACAQKVEGPPPQPGAVAPAQDPNAAVKPALPASAQVSMPCKEDAQCRNEQICVSGACGAVTANMQECSNHRIHFPFNKAEFADSEKNSLLRLARCLSANNALKVTIEGNADERGTEEYNLALGQKRAQTVAKYLETMGATAAQVKTISYGKDKPVCAEHDEACWKKNRSASTQLGNAE